MSLTRYIKNSNIYGVGETIVGQVRKANEDNCGYAQTFNGELFVVCDGMGGHVGGATASRIAVESIISFISQNRAASKPELLQNALMFANMQILGESMAVPSLKGMGTTACIALIDGEEIWLAHVGDSRIYFYSDKKKFLYRASKDHSLVQGLVDKGQLDDRDAEHHPQKNIILRALGTKEDIVPDVETKPVYAAKNDIILMCSDGLSGMIDDTEMEAILKDDKLELQDKLEKLINEANAPGKGKDNITCQLIRKENANSPVGVFPDFTPNWRRGGIFKTGRTGKNGMPAWLWWLLGGIVALVAVVVAGLLIMKGGRDYKKVLDVQSSQIVDLQKDAQLNPQDTIQIDTIICADARVIISKDYKTLDMKGVTSREVVSLDIKKKGKYFPERILLRITPAPTAPAPKAFEQLFEEAVEAKDTLAFSKTDITLQKNEAKLDLTKLLSDKTGGTLRWNSSNKDILYVTEHGEVVRVGEGTDPVTIQVVSALADGTLYKASIKVIMRAADKRTLETIKQQATQYQQSTEATTADPSTTPSKDQNPEQKKNDAEPVDEPGASSQDQASEPSSQEQNQEPASTPQSTPTKPSTPSQPDSKDKPDFGQGSLT